MRPEQGVLTKHRKPPDTTSNEKEHEKCDLTSLEKPPLDLPNHAEQYRSILGWSRSAVSRTTVSKNSSTARAVEVAPECEKSVNISFISSPMQSELYCDSQQAEKCDAGHVNDSTHGVGEMGSTEEANHDLQISSKHQMSPIPGICIDKPLPPSPARSLSADSSRSPHAPESHSHENNEETSYERTNLPLLTTKPSVRRIKSYGDLLSSAPKRPRPLPVERRASHVDLRSDSTIVGQRRPSDRQHSGEQALTEQDVHSTASFLSPDTISTPHSDGSSRGGFLKKRASSLGLGRRASSHSTETIKASDQDAVRSEAALPARNVSSATAPPLTRTHDTDASRKRKPSMFGGLFSGLWRAKSKDTIVNSTANTSSADLLLPPAEVLSGQGIRSMQSLHDTGSQTRSSSSASSETSIVDRGPKFALSVPLTDSDEHLELRAGPPFDRLSDSTSQPRRYSIMHNFFRSVPTSKPASGKESNGSLRPPVTASHSPDLTVEPEPSIRQPIDIPHSTLPQLPSISRDLGEISFGSLFDGGERRSRGRSRASTRGSLSSLFSTPAQARSISPHLEPATTGSPNIASPRSRSNSQLQQSVTASDLASGLGRPLHSPATGQEELSNTHTSVERNADAEQSCREPSRSPIVNGIIAEDSRRTRLFRSNSASSVTTTSWITPLEPSKLESKSNRPLFNRARSSSTISTTNKAIRTLSPLFEGAGPNNGVSSQTRSPAILVTSEQHLSPYFENAHHPGSSTSVESPTGTNFDSLSRASRSSSVSTGVASPSLPHDGFLTTSQLSPSADANLVDAMTDFVLAPATTLDMRISADSQSSSFSHASSLLSSSPVTSHGAGQNSRTSSILNKTLLRRRANTMGPSSTTSTPPEITDPHELNIRGAGSLDTAEILNRPGRSGSSSRLSSFFGSPASTFSTSPTESSGLWLAPRDPTKAASASNRNTYTPRSIARRLSSSLLTSSRVVEDPSSNTSSPLLSASITPESVGPGHGQRDIDTPQDVAGTSASPNRSRSSTAVASDLRVNAMAGDTPSTFLTRVKSSAGPQDIARLLSEK